MASGMFENRLGGPSRLEIGRFESPVMMYFTGWSMKAATTTPFTETPFNLCLGVLSVLGVVSVFNTSSN